MQTLLIVIIVVFFLSIFRVLYGLFVNKKIKPVDHERLEKELEKAKTMNNQVFVLFEDGYWEFKEEVHSKEWSATNGTQSYIDFDSDIDDKRYQNIMNKELIRNTEGEHELKIVKEVEIDKNTIFESFYK